MNSNDRIYKQELALKDARFNVDLISRYRLYLVIGKDHFKLWVMDSFDKRCLMLEDYRFYSPLEVDELLTALDRIWDSHSSLKANFWQKVSVLVKAKPFTLVPQSVLEQDHLFNYLKPVVGEEKLTNHSIFMTSLAGIGAVEIFGIENELVNWFQKTYPQREVGFYHQVSPFLEGIYKLNEKQRQAQMHIFVEYNHLVLCVQRGGKLELCNIYPYRTAQDFIYFVLFVMDELGLERENCDLKIYGMISQVSEIFRLLRTYVQKINIVSVKPAWISFSHEYDNLPFHYYFDSFCLPICK
jgi:Protein of unknown function (DUF3822)